MSQFEQPQAGQSRRPDVRESVACCAFSRRRAAAAAGIGICAAGASLLYILLRHPSAAAQEDQLVAALRRSYAESNARLEPHYAELLGEGVQAAAEVMEAFPRDAESVAVLAAVSYLAHDLLLEIRCWERCLQLDPGFRLAYSRLGNLAMERGEYEEALTRMRQALQSAPKDAEFRTLMARALMSLGRAEEARDLLQAYLSGGGSDPMVHFCLGQVLAQLNDHEGARLHFLTTIELAPSYTQAYHGLATACTRLGRSDEAERYNEQFAAWKAKDRQAENRDAVRDDQFLPGRVAQVLTDAAGVYWRHDAARQAERCWRRAAQLAPSRRSCRRGLATLYHRQGRFAEARAVVEELAQLEPENPEHCLTLGVLCWQLNDFDRAEEAFQRVCRLAPGVGKGYAALAEFYLRRGEKLSEAKELAAKAVQLQPTARNYAILATACQSLDDLAGARNHMQQAVMLEPNNVEYVRTYQSFRDAER